MCVPGSAEVTFDPEYNVVLTRTVFFAKKIAKAELTVTALGFFEAYVNGAEVSGDRLIPAKRTAPRNSTKYKSIAITMMPRASPATSLVFSSSFLSIEPVLKRSFHFSVFSNCSK